MRILTAPILSLLLMLIGLACTTQTPESTVISNPVATVPPETAAPVLPTSTPEAADTLEPEPTATPASIPDPTTPSDPTATTQPTPTREPTATPTLTSAVLPTVECTPKPCNTSFVGDHLDWIKPPQVSAGGEFSLVARIHDGHDLIVATPAPDGGRLNLHFTSESVIYGSILPVDNTPGWRWKEKPSSWEADVYSYEGKVLTVIAQIDPAAATHPGLRACLWSGGATREETYILGCREVEQP